jgi:D-alanyl-D-alanine dipeptidase
MMKPWQAVPIVECGEKLVSLRGYHPRILVSPQYFLRRIPGAMDDCLAREGTARQLARAAESLQGDLCLLVWDAWRSKEVQAQLFEEYRSILRKKLPDLSEAELDEKTIAFVSRPSTDPSAPSPHNTGGAVDLTLANASGAPLPLGTDFDEFTPRAVTGYFEERAISVEEQTFAKNRRLLLDVMQKAGFANYQGEWWHFDHGDQWWALATGQEKAIYGPIAPS